MKGVVPAEADAGETHMTPNDIKDHLAQALSHRRDVRLAVLFGSQARGAARSDSDVDLAVDAPGVDTVALAVELADVLGRDVDVVSLHADSIPLLHSIVRDGIVVHEARRGAGALWRSHALATLEIDLPWFRRMADPSLARFATRAGAPTSPRRGRIEASGRG